MGSRFSKVIIPSLVEVGEPKKSRVEKTIPHVCTRPRSKVMREHHKIDLHQAQPDSTNSGKQLVALFIHSADRQILGCLANHSGGWQHLEGWC